MSDMDSAMGRFLRSDPQELLANADEDDLGSILAHLEACAAAVRARMVARSERSTPGGAQLALDSSVLVQEALSFANARDLCQACRVSTSWRTWATAKVLWQPLVCSRWPGMVALGDAGLENGDFKSLYISRALLHMCNNKEPGAECTYCGDRDLSNYAVLVELSWNGQNVLQEVLEFHEPCDEIARGTDVSLRISFPNAPNEICNLPPTDAYDEGRPRWGFVLSQGEVCPSEVKAALSLTVIRKKLWNGQSDNTFIPLCSHLPLEAADHRGYKKGVAESDSNEDSSIPFELIRRTLAAEFQGIASESSDHEILIFICLGGLQFEDDDGDRGGDALIGFKHINLQFSVPVEQEFCNLEFNQIASIWDSSVQKQ